MDVDVVSVRHVLPQNVVVAHTFPGVHQDRTRRRDTRDQIQERFAQHHIRQAAFIHVKPAILESEGLSLVDQHYVRGAHFHDGRRRALYFARIAMMEMDWLGVAPGRSSPYQLPTKIRVH